MVGEEGGAVGGRGGVTYPQAVYIFDTLLKAKDDAGRLTSCQHVAIIAEIVAKPDPRKFLLSVTAALTRLTSLGLSSNQDATGGGSHHQAADFNSLPQQIAGHFPGGCRYIGRLLRLAIVASIQAAAVNQPEHCSHTGRTV